MLCCICKEKEATVHLTQIAGDKMQKVDLCEECAKTKGVNDPTGFSLADLLLGLGASQEIEQAGAARRSSAPGAVLRKLIQEGRAGWVVLSAIRRSQSRSRDWSKRCTKGRATSEVPEAFRQNRDLSDKLKALQKRLSKAIESEDFEEAAILRDEIKQTSAD
jgi:protein arginine kinase activator